MCELIEIPVVRPIHRIYSCAYLFEYVFLPCIVIDSPDNHRLCYWRDQLERWKFRWSASCRWVELSDPSESSRCRIPGNQWIRQADFHASFGERKLHLWYFANHGVLSGSDIGCDLQFKRNKPLVSSWSKWSVQQVETYRIAISGGWRWLSCICECQTMWSNSRVYLPPHLTNDQCRRWSSRRHCQPYSRLCCRLPPLIRLSPRLAQ